MIRRGPRQRPFSFQPEELGKLMNADEKRQSAFTTLLFAVLLLSIGTAVFWPGLRGWFVFDDHVNLVLSEQWKVTSSEWRDWRRAFASDISGAVGRPLAMGTFAINHYITGLNPFWLKAGNLGLHLFNGLLVWRLCGLVFQMTSSVRDVTLHAAWLVALAWTIHPLHVSTVMYIVQRMEIGAATGILLSLLAYVIGRSRQIDSQTCWPWLAISPLAMLLGLGFKETALLTPGFALAIELMILRFRCPSSRASRNWKLTWGAIALAGLLLYFALIAPQLQNWPYGFRSFGPMERVITQLPVLTMYIQQSLFPVPESMRFYYDNYPVSQNLLEPSWTAVSAGILLFLVALGITTFRRFPLTSLGIAWFFIGHALTSNLWPLELAFEHRNYLPLLGLLIALAQPLQGLLTRFSSQARAVIAALPITFLAALCSLQAHTWSDPLRLAWTLENRNPESPRASYDLASQLLIAANDDPKSPFWSMALKQFEHGALTAEPSALSLQGLLLMHGRAGIDPSPHYWDLLQTTLATQKLHSEHLGSLHALTACHIQRRCTFDSSEMLKTLVTAVQHNPDNPTVHTLYANFAWNVLNDHPLAITLQREAARLDPSNPAYRIALAKFLLASASSEPEGHALLRQLRDNNRAGQFDKELAELEQLTGHVNDSANKPK